MRQIQNPPNPYLKYSSEFLGEPPAAKLEVFEEIATRTIVSQNKSPDIGFRYSVNCYRGCIHACTYCFARRYHEYLGYGAGTDFETKIVVKINAPKLLRKELLNRKSLRGELIAFSFTTDPYLPLEASYELTRECLKACRDFGNPVSIVTKSPLITRDIDVLCKLKKVSVYFSIPFLTVETSRLFEPFAPKPEVRFEAMRKLADAGITVGIGIAPVIPTYNDSEIPALLEKARESGATGAFMNLVHFDTDTVRDYFVSRLQKSAPTKADKILNQIKRERSGDLRHKNLQERMRGKTEQWRLTEQLFELHYKRLGFGQNRPERGVEIPQIPVQQSLFD